MRAVLLAVTALSLSVTTAAQNMPRFEVVSIRPNRSGDGGAFFQVLPGGRFLAQNATALELVRASYAFEFEPFQIVGGEPWTREERFNVDARAGRDLPPPEVNAMLPALLADRFALVLRRETRLMPIYALGRARPGTLGPRLRLATGACVTLQLGPDGSPVPPPPDTPECGLRSAPASVVNGVRLAGSHVTMAQLSRRLSQYLQRAIVDDSALFGLFNVDVEFSDPRRALPTDNAGALDVLSIFTAMKDQLGLQLESRTGPVEVLVIERAQRPTEN